MTEIDFLDHPVLIAGHRRSGTTAFLNLLEGHPQLCTFPADSGFFYGYFPPYDTDAYTVDQKLNRIIDFCYGNLREEVEKVNHENPDQPPLDFPFETLHQNFRQQALQSHLTPKSLLTAMIAAYWQTYGLPSAPIAWVEKTSSSEIYANYIFDWFPQARFLHVIRDPRDNYSSLKSGWAKNYQQRGEDPRQLIQSMIDRGRLGMELARYNQQRYGKASYLVLKYEDLIQQPRQTMAEVAEFLGIEDHDSLLKPTVCGRSWRGNNFDGTVFHTLSDLNIGRWRDRITPEECQVIEYYFRDVMAYFEYAPAFPLHEAMDAVVEYYKWYNYAQHFRV
ncbi:hypothetical protein DO97_10825 [Neosynechococcus sphagnicola sy1]|uniref:Sulfotransferase n=1 Tax=Neosynechococcus sphagnicola sy1 TaxID=1497020 RepID=A0A098TN75_9CYAN|nr:sulfotransferase [Neosynechococcus sphagnicola]KGF72293.1 hypothetical protein DO97_10825 [Neosynechococcus sphagnicola sy1]